MSPEDRTCTYAVLKRVGENQWPKFQDKLEDFEWLLSVMLRQ
jgi:hypothetical protein